MQQVPAEPIAYAPRPQLPPLRRSGVGVASFWVAIASTATLVAVFHWAIEGRAASDTTAYKLLGLTFVLPAAGTLLGVASVFQRRRYRGLPTAGLTINALLALFLLLITVPSLLHELGYW